MKNKKRYAAVRKRQWVVGFFLLFMCSMLMTSTISLADNISKPISLKPILPDSQIDKKSGFYDLIMKPGEKQTLEFEIYNTNKEDVTLSVAVNPAYTSDGGDIYYSKNSKDIDESQKFPMDSLVEISKTIGVPAKGSTKEKFEIKMPDAPINGIILGGLHVKMNGEKYKKNKDEVKGIALDNKVDYVIAIRLRQNLEPVKPKLVLKSVSAAQIAGRNTIKAKLQNPTTTIIDEVSYDASIYKKGSNERLYSNSVENYRVAPNTSYNFPIGLNNKAFQAGDYTIKMTVKSEETGDKWVFNQDFTIEKEEARKLNNSSVELETDYRKYIVIGIAILIVLVFTIIILKKMDEKKKKETMEKRRRKSHSNKPKKKSSTSKKSKNSKQVK